MPRYEKQDGDLIRFWELDLRAEQVTICEGVVDGAESTRVEQFSDPRAASRSAMQQLLSKVRDGYAKVGYVRGTTQPTPPAPPPLEEALELPSHATLDRRLADDPSDLDAWATYGDWLSDQGEPQGELVALGVLHARGEATLQQTQRQAELLKDHGGSSLAPLPERLAGSARFAFGFVKDLRIPFVTSDCGPAVIEAFLGGSGARFLRALELFKPASADYRPVLQALGRAGPLPALRSLILGGRHEDELDMPSWIHGLDVSDLWGQLPNLEELIIQGGGIELGVVKHAQLRTLRLRTGGLDRTVVKSLEDAELPALETLELWFGEEDYGARIERVDLEPLLARPDLPALRHLGLRNANRAVLEGLMAVLARSPLLPPLVSLDLSLGTLLTSDLGPLLECAARMPQLERLDVSDNFLEPDAEARLREAFPKGLVFGDQKEEELDDDEPWYYTSVGE